MRIYKIAAVTPEQNKKRIDDLDSDIKSIKRDLKSLDSDIKKVAKDVKEIRTEIGSRSFWQQSTVFTSIQRKLERYERLEVEWGEFKKSIKEELKLQLEQAHRAQIRVLGPNP